MSDDFEDKPAAVPATKVPRKRPAARKKAKPSPAADDASEPAPRKLESAPVAEERKPEPRESRASEDRDSAPEPIPFFVENNSSEPPGNNKKRRRRKKKHGQPQGQHPHAVAPVAETSHAVVEAAPSPAPVMHAAPRPKLDPEEVSRKAWKIFLSEVGEEGLALIDDHDAREISRRCFRLAEVFLEEAARRAR